MMMHGLANCKFRSNCWYYLTVKWHFTLNSNCQIR